MTTKRKDNKVSVLKMDKILVKKKTKNAMKLKKKSIFTLRNKDTVDSGRDKATSTVTSFCTSFSFYIFVNSELFVFCNEMKGQIIPLFGSSNGQTCI